MEIIDSVIEGDVLNILPHVEDDSIHLIFTSPPYYNAREYSQFQSYSDYLTFLDKVFHEVHRITAEGRFLVVNTSPVLEPRLNRQSQSKRYPIPFDLNHLLLQGGWDFIDDIVWVKPEPSVKNRNGGFYQHRKPLGYKPNLITEYVMVYRKHTDKLIDWNMRQYTKDVVELSKVDDGYETSNVWYIQPSTDKIHPATFPAELCRRVISYYSYEGDLVFDPFAGSGTTGRVAKELKRHYFMTEQCHEYVQRIHQLLTTW